MFFYIVLAPISTTSGLWSTGNTRKYNQIDVYIYQYDISNKYQHFRNKLKWRYRIKKDNIKANLQFIFQEYSNQNPRNNIQ